MSYSSISYTLGFSCGRVRASLTYSAHLKRELELLQGCDSLLSLSRCVAYMSLAMFWCCLLVMVGIQDAVTHDHYLHDMLTLELQ